MITRYNLNRLATALRFCLIFAAVYFALHSTPIALLAAPPAQQSPATPSDSAITHSAPKAIAFESINELYNLCARNPSFPYDDICFDLELYYTHAQLIQLARIDHKGIERLCLYRDDLPDLCPKRPAGTVAIAITFGPVARMPREINHSPAVDLAAERITAPHSQHNQRQAAYE